MINTHLPMAKIISYNSEGERVCASAAKISTTPGDAIELYNSANNNESNRKLIAKVLKSGHVSIFEHAVFTIAFVNVSAVVEQFLIENRLASFTVKSRRYVDYSNQGYYIPKDLKNNKLDSYVNYMDALFNAYSSLVNLGIPKEDARFLLPYSFNSNLYCTLNARELAYIINTIKNGRGKDVQELQLLAEQLEEQLSELFPLALKVDSYNQIQPTKSSFTLTFYDTSFIESTSAGRVELVQFPRDPEMVLMEANRIATGEDCICLDELIRRGRPRELEQLSYTFRIFDITLSGITHMVRHRMQSIIVPPLGMIDGRYQILPDSIKENKVALDIYNVTVSKASKMRNLLLMDPVLSKYSYYYLLSGTLTNIITTMNARELLHFIQLRTCNRAQWEIRTIAINMLNLVRNSFPDLFNSYGPSCFVKGFCPEGKLTCGEIDVVLENFKGEGK